VGKTSPQHAFSSIFPRKFVFREVLESFRASRSEVGRCHFWTSRPPPMEYGLVWMVLASGELNTAMPPVAMLLLGARAGVVSLIEVFVALALIVLFLRLSLN
jgi:hypothetical protein